MTLVSFHTIKIIKKEERKIRQFYSISSVHIKIVNSKEIYGEMTTKHADMTALSA